MASISGSHFVALAAEPVNVVETSNGRNLPPPIPGDFNLEVWTGSRPPGSPAPGYNGLAVLGPGGTAITLVTGSYEIKDSATGGGTDTLTANGDAQTIAGGPGNNDVFVVNGTGDAVVGGGQDTIDVYGDHATINGVGNDLIQLFGDYESVDGGTGNDTILVYSDSRHDTINAGSGADLIEVTGRQDYVDGNGGNDTILVLSGAANDTIEAGGGHNTVIVDSSGNTVIGGGGNNTVDLNAAKDAYSGGSGGYTIEVGADQDTATGGSGTGAIIATGNRDVLSAGTGGADTIDSTGNNNTIAGGMVPSAAGGQITSFGDDDLINLGRSGTVLVGGSADTINAGASPSGDFDTITLAYGSQELADNGQVFVDTVVGFDQAAGDRIHLAPHDHVSWTTAVNGGHDTLITLSDASTILLKGVTQVDHSFFS
jgi:Ca2+-binding RTX toxin-like protein